MFHQKLVPSSLRRLQVPETPSADTQLQAEFHLFFNF